MKFMMLIEDLYICIVSAVSKKFKSKFMFPLKKKKNVLWTLLSLSHLMISSKDNET